MSRKPKKTTSPEPPQKRIWLWFSLAIIVLSGILYANTLQNSYALDDKGIITGNKFTQKGFAGIPDLLTTSYWEGVGINVRSYRPLAPVTFAAEVGIWGMNPAVSHFFNMVICMMTGLILLYFLRLLFRIADPTVSAAVPFIITLLFLAHPVHTEVVANIKGRDSMLEMMFLLLSGYFLLRYITTSRIADLAVSVASFFPALLSKESAITYIAMVPVMLILFDSGPLKKKALTTLWYLAPVAVFLILFYQYSDIRAFTQLHLFDNSLVADAPPASIWATKFLILGKYLWLLIFPHPLLYDYSYNQVPLAAVSNPVVWVAFLVYAAAAVFAVYVLAGRVSGKKTTAFSLVAAFSIAWFYMGFFASSNLVMLIGATMAERFMYSPSLGFLLVLVFGLYLLFTKGFRQPKPGGAAIYMLYATGALLLVGYSLKTIDRNKDWKDDFTLFSTDLKYLGENAKANDFLANQYRKMGDDATGQEKTNLYLKAIALKEKAVLIYPKVPEILQQLAFLYGNTGQFEKSIDTYKTAIAMNPGEIMNYVQIGKACGMKGRIPEGLTYLRQGEKINPENTELISTLGIMYAQTGVTEKALAYFEKAYAKDPSNKQIEQYLRFTKSQLLNKKK